MSGSPPAWFDRTFSQPRLAPYLSAAHLNVTQAIELYLWNLQASEAFYPALHCLEISLRNVLHAQLQDRYGRPDWWEVAPLDTEGRRLVAKARVDARRGRPARVGADDIVAQLSFGFWVSLLSRRYDRYFWVPALNKAFPYYSGSRSALHANLEAMRLLRNRIMHHEPIRHRHLEADHAKIYQLLGYIAPDAVSWLQPFDRVPAVLASRPKL